MNHDLGFLSLAFSSSIFPRLNKELLKNVVYNKEIEKEQKKILSQPFISY